MFCVSCGSFIAIGSKAKPTPESAPFSGPLPVPGDADVDVSLPFVEGVSPLGSYSMEAQRRATRRTRTMTAVTSAVLAMVIGGAALYLASPLSERDDQPQTAAVASSSAPQPTERTGAVSGISLEPEAVLAPEGAAEPPVEPVTEDVVLEPIEELAVEPVPDLEPLAQPPAAETEPIMELERVPEPETAAEPEPVPLPIVESEPAAQSQPVVSEPAVRAQPAVEPELVQEPAVEPEPVIESVARSEPGEEPEPVIEPEPVEAALGSDPIEATPADDGDTTGQSVPGGPLRSATSTTDEPVAYDGSWVCSEEIVIDDRRVRDWSVSRVSFRIRDGFERVVLQLERAGGGSGDPASITADSMGSWKVDENVPGAGRPGLGRRSVTLRLDDGFSGSLSLRGYRPSGLDIIKEFSVYRAARDGRNVVISADTDGCYRVRVPAWNDPSGSVRRAEIHVDIKP